MYLEEDSSPCGIFGFESISPVVQIHKGCRRSKHKFTMLCYVALPLSVKNSSLALGHRNPGLNRLWVSSSFHVVLLSIRFPILCLRLFFPMNAYGFSNKCAHLQGFQCTDMCIFCSVLFMTEDSLASREAVLSCT